MHETLALGTGGREANGIFVPSHTSENHKVLDAKGSFCTNRNSYSSTTKQMPLQGSQWGCGPRWHGRLESVTFCFGLHLSPSLCLASWHTWTCWTQSAGNTLGQAKRSSQFSLARPKCLFMCAAIVLITPSHFCDCCCNCISCPCVWKRKNRTFQRPYLLARWGISEGFFILLCYKNSVAFCFQAVKACGMERRPPAFLGGRKLESSCQHFHALSCENPGQQSNSLPFYQSPFITDPNIHVTDTVVLADPARCHSCFWWTPQLKAQECYQTPPRSSKALVWCYPEISVAVQASESTCWTQILQIPGMCLGCFASWETRKLHQLTVSNKHILSGCLWSFIW